MLSKNTFQFAFIVSLILVMGFFTGCSPQIKSPTVEASPSAVVVENPVTPTPQAETPEIWLIAGPEVDEAVKQKYSDWLTIQTEQNGQILVTYDSFLSSEIPAQLQTVVFLSEPEDLSNLAANLPDTQFVVNTQTDLQPSSNVSVIQESKYDALFLAGYLAILNSPDFRAGALLMDDGSGNLQQQAFVNGGHYFCGRCSPVFAPIVAFPQVVLVPVGADAVGFQTAFDTLNQNRIEMLYLPAEALLSPFLDYLAAQGIGVISNAPPPGGYESLWVAMVSSDSFSAFERLWPQIEAGTGGLSIRPDLTLTNINSDRLSIGRQQLTEQLIPPLMADAIEPLDLP